MRRDNSQTRLRHRLAGLAQFAIDALDALDAPEIDREDDDAAEDGGDAEPSLGATLDLDQRLAWGADRASFLADGEAAGTLDDIEVSKPESTRRADRLAACEALARLRLMAERHGFHSLKRSFSQ